MNTSNDAGATSERELVVTRILDAPRELVFKAWTDPQHLVHWWGPKGFTITVREIDVRQGGVWRFILHGPDGTDHENKITYIEIVEPERLIYIHGGETADESEQFRVTVAFADQGGRTTLTIRMVFASTAARDKAINEIGAIAGANQTLDRLEAQLAEMG